MSGAGGYHISSPLVSGLSDSPSLAVSPVSTTPLEELLPRNEQLVLHGRNNETYFIIIQRERAYNLTLVRMTATRTKMIMRIRNEETTPTIVTKLIAATMEWGKVSLEVRISEHSQMPSKVIMSSR